MLATLEKLGYEYVIPVEDATPNGAIESLSDARICAELFQKNQQKIDGIIVILPNFGDELESGLTHSNWQDYRFRSSYRPAMMI